MRIQRNIGTVERRSVRKSGSWEVLTELLTFSPFSALVLTRSSLCALLTLGLSGISLSLKGKPAPFHRMSL